MRDAATPLVRDADGRVVNLPMASDDKAARVRSLARLLDSAVRIPGTNIRFGLDSLIGFVPGVGDVAGAAFSGYIVLAAARLGVPATVLTRMLVNLATDAAVGAIPLIGDLFDVSFKANTRNAALLDQHLGAPLPGKKASRLTIVAVVGGLVLLAVGAVALTVLLFRGLNALIT